MPHPPTSAAPVCRAVRAKYPDATLRTAGGFYQVVRYTARGRLVGLSYPLPTAFGAWLNAAMRHAGWRRPAPRA